MTTQHLLISWSVFLPLGPFLYNSCEKWEWGKWDGRKEGIFPLQGRVPAITPPGSAARLGPGPANSPRLQLVTNDWGVRIIPVAATDCAPSSICIYFHGAFKLVFATSKPHWPWSRKESQNPLIANYHLNILSPSSVNMIFPHKRWEIQPERFGLHVPRRSTCFFL